jgi:hypothetical protein
MARALSGMALGVVAALLASVGHVAGGGSAVPITVVILMLASALVFAAAAELRAPMWALATLGALVQVAGHILMAPLGGHAGTGAHAHGMPGQAAAGALNATVMHLAEGGGLMIAMHAVSFAALVAVLALAAPLSGLLVSLQRTLAPARIEPAFTIPALSGAASLIPSSVLRHVVIRRGPPAFV